MEEADGSKEWWINGKEISEEDFTGIKMIIKIKAFELFTPRELVAIRKKDAIV